MKVCGAKTDNSLMQSEFMVLVTSRSVVQIWERQLESGYFRSNICWNSILLMNLKLFIKPSETVVADVRCEDERGIATAIMTNSRGELQ